MPDLSDFIAAGGGGVKTTGTLAHTSGAISADVQAAYYQRFTSDDVVTQINTLSFVGTPVRNLGTVMTATGDLTEVDLPAGVQDGDLIVVMWASDFSGELLRVETNHDITPKNYEQHFFSDNATPSAGLWTFLADGTQGGRVRFRWAYSSPSDSYGSYLIFVVRGADPDAPITGLASTNVSSGTPTTPAILTPRDGSLVISGLFWDDDANTFAGTVPSGFTLIGNGYSSSSGSSVMAAHDTDVNAGTFTPGAWNPTNHNDSVWGITFAIVPAFVQVSGEANYTVTLTNELAAGEVWETVLSFNMDADVETVGGGVTWPSGIVWDENAAPVMTPGMTHVMLFDVGDNVTRGRVVYRQDASANRVANLTGTTPTIDPQAGGILRHSLSGNTTYEDGLSDGQTTVLRLQNGGSYTVSWPDTMWVGGAPPILASNDIIMFWKEGSQLWGNQTASW